MGYVEVCPEKISWIRGMFRLLHKGIYSPAQVLKRARTEIYFDCKDKPTKRIDFAKLTKALGFNV